jgi:two-component system CheB/CheR fusion protein
LGIGLALVKQLTELHEGTVQAHSDGIGRGARFTVRLPLVKASETITAGDSRSPRGGLRGARILVVDDSHDSLEMLRILLSSEGAQLTTAAGGQEALNLARSENFDLIISDISMPEMDGYELLTRLRDDPRLAQIPAIALTGFGRPEDVARAREVGFTSHITKPLDFDYLVELARTALR